MKKPLIAKTHSRLNMPELMDDPGSDHQKLINTVRQFRGINVMFSRSRAIIRKYILSVMTPGTPEPYTLLDVGSGGCDIALWLHSYCKKKTSILK